ncbi:MAG: zinc-dependent metalloprotease [Bdellovibrionota bacterium]
MPLMQLRKPERLPEFAQKEAALPTLQGAELKAQDALKRMYKEMGHVRNTTVYPLSAVLSDALQMSLEGLSDDDILETLIYRVAIHEFGHNLGLRHNFYGSVDSGWFCAASPATR